MTVLNSLHHLAWREFEHLCLVLFERYYDAPDANFYGANSYGQDGVDIRLTTTKGGTPARVVIQCKAVQSLGWSNFSSDLRRALKRFARNTVTEGRNFTFIVATTAEIENTIKIDAKKDELIRELDMGDIREHIHVHVYTAPRLKEIAYNDLYLRKAFYPADRPADKQLTQELIALEVRLTRYVDRNELANAQRDLAAYLHSAKPSDPEKYNWVPTVLFDKIAYLTMAAGDFERAHKLLNTALGVDPHYARYILGYLRARRVLHSVPHDNLPRSHMFEQPIRIPSPEDDVGNMAQQLLAAAGEIDQQLTLALWVVSYAKTQELAEQGLSRALGLVALAWPSNVARLAKDAHYMLSKEGYFDKIPLIPARHRPPASNEHLRACALALGYNYIRGVHCARFGLASVSQVEAANDGWPVMFEGVSRRNGTTYFAGLHPACRRALDTYLPSLVAEGAGRELDPLDEGGLIQKRPARLEHNRYAVTPSFLLRDCDRELVKRRIGELAQGGMFTLYGASIQISHLGLERLVQVQLGECLGLNEHRLPLRSTTTVKAIAEIFKHVIRYEPAGDQRPLGRRPPFVSSPCYANFAAGNRLSSDLASIELARRDDLPFIANSPTEMHIAMAELPPASKHLAYWEPPISVA